MPKAKPSPSGADIAKAIDAALRGTGWQLAALIKSFSVEDLAEGLGRHRGCLAAALHHAAGRKEQRELMRRERHAIRGRRNERGESELA